MSIKSFVPPLPSSTGLMSIFECPLVRDNFFPILQYYSQNPHYKGIKKRNYINHWWHILITLAARFNKLYNQLFGTTNYVLTLYFSIL